MYDYVIVGGGRAGISAVEGIRELDQSGSILLVGVEPHLPYDRPPLSKQLWSGKKTVDEVFVHDAGYFKGENIRLATSERVIEVRPAEKAVVTDQGRSESYGKLLLATGGEPKRLRIPGAGLEGVVYYRTLDHYKALSRDPKGKSILVVGGGFIGSEIAAALNQRGARVTMVFPGRYLCESVFPASLALSSRSLTSIPFRTLSPAPIASSTSGSTPAPTTIVSHSSRSPCCVWATNPPFFGAIEVRRFPPRMRMPRSS